MLKTVLTLMILFAATITYVGHFEEHMKFSAIGIEYVGESDKPITPIVISDSKAGAEWFRSTVLKRSDLGFTDAHVVSASLMAKPTADAETHSGLGLQGKKLQSAATVSITIVKSQSKVAFLPTTEKGLSLLRILKEDCKQDESLYSDLMHFENRIAP